MQQRRLRLGDILDDYCPRERRITNHAVVAMIDDKVQQTRCSTCDAEHEYKDGKAPAPRRKKPSGALASAALDETRPRAVAVASSESSDEAMPSSDESASDDDRSLAEDAQPAFAASSESEIDPDDDLSRDDDVRDDDGPVHRRLIRATLPRPEGQTPERTPTDFTMRQPTGRDFGNNRPGGHRRAPGQGQGQQRGARPGHGGQPSGPGRFAGPRDGNGQGPRPGAGQGGQGGGGQRQGNRPGATGQPASNKSGGSLGGPRPPGGQRRRRGR